MTIVVDTAKAPAHLVAHHLRKLVPVVEVRDVTHVPPGSSAISPSSG